VSRAREAEGGAIAFAERLLALTDLCLGHGRAPERLSLIDLIWQEFDIIQCLPYCS
jgi:hypothetical protein